MRAKSIRISGQILMARREEKRREEKYKQKGLGKAPPQDASRRKIQSYSCGLMHYDAHQPIIDDLEARIVTIRDSL
jgi:hypothetical protein